MWGTYKQFVCTHVSIYIVYVILLNVLIKTSSGDINWIKTQSLLCVLVSASTESRKLFLKVGTEAAADIADGTEFRWSLVLEHGTQSLVC